MCSTMTMANFCDVHDCFIFVVDNMYSRSTHFIHLAFCSLANGDGDADAKFISVISFYRLNIETTTAEVIICVFRILLIHTCSSVVELLYTYIIFFLGGSSLCWR